MGRRIIGLLAVFAAFAAKGCSPPVAETEPGASEAALEMGALEAGDTGELEIAGGEVHRYRLTLEAGDFVELRVEQLGIDVATSLNRPDGTPLRRVDGPTGALGVERLIASAPRDGRYALEVAAASGKPPGRYRLGLEVRPAAVVGDTERRRVAAAARFADADELRRARRYDEASAAYRQAADGYRQAADEEGEAESLLRLGLVERYRRRWRDAAAASEAAAAYFEAVDRAHAAALARDNEGRARFQAGDVESAIASYERALELRRQAGDRRGEGITLNQLGFAARLRGELRAALDYYDRAAAIWQQLDDRRERANTLYNLGVVHRFLGEHTRAADRLRDALEIYTAEGILASLAATEDQLGRLDEARGDAASALARYQRSAALATRGEDPQQVAIARLRVGWLHYREGRPEDAEPDLEEALAAFRALDDRANEERALLYLGSVAAERGALEVARERLGRALDIARRIGDPISEAEASAALAGALRRSGDLEAASIAIANALGIYEGLRRQPLDHDRRARFFATVQDAYDLAIELAMARHAIEPAAGWARHAWATSERARARSLLDLLATAGVEPGGDPELRRLGVERRRLQDELNRLAWRRDHHRRGDADPATVAAVERGLRDALDALAGVRAAIRARSPRAADLIEPEPLDLARIQALLDPSTLLLEYHLGASDAYLWTIDRQRLDGIVLGPTAEVEAAARRARSLLARSHRRETAAATARALCALSRMVLAPVADRLGDRRLLIVGDGALATVPFAALPDPRQLADCATTAVASPTTPRPLIERHELLALPSASTLAALRRRRAAPGRQPADGLLALVADPVYAADDPRLATLPTPASEPSAFPRLPYASREAEAILAAVEASQPSASVDVATGFEAEREIVIGGALSGYRFVHFATHAVIDVDQPQLSGVVLSLVDERGRPRDGFLRLHEIYDLELDAELVTLSACRTALGKPLAGEGLIGLTRGFLHAGARRVLVSLWPVDDRATAALMDHFYRRLWARGESPSAALRSAQRALRRERRWRAPYHWAPFVVVGD